VDDGPWSVDEFARAAGTTVRNVRLYQERGLVPKPARSGRRAEYGAEHMARLRLVLMFLERGYPLAVIRDLLDAWQANRSLGDVLGFEEALAAFAPEAPRRFTPEELQARFQADIDGSALRRAVDIGILTPDGDGFVAAVPSLIDVGAELVAAGVPVTAVLDTSAEIQAAAQHLATAFVRLFVSSLWEPFVAAGKPADGWIPLTAALQKLRGVWPQAVLPALARAIDDEIEATSRAIASEDVAEQTHDAS
jgi:DNA-binding transcriptional MerR regulator